MMHQIINKASLVLVCSASCSPLALCISKSLQQAHLILKQERDKEETTCTHTALGCHSYCLIKSNQFVTYWC